ncbi:FKBP-type peptidyl-prolyl cis-trans isomerase [Archangium sp.]|uniref:FKBP-type peptidyl-prolyl cis-trans isomerase n=1 Tax=Archangium sp. TaxID=1872627 RepID=UPI00286A5B0B|nr:FKBP-type peptidyl-prolyl cis-trans isomerase [Archangium sp.]
MRLGICTAVLLGLVGFQANAQEPKTEEEKTIYALGLSIGRSIKSYDLTQAELDILKKGLSDAATGAKPAVEMEKYLPKLQPLAKGRQDRVGKRFLEDAAKEKGAVKLPSGVIYKELVAGKGQSPKATDTVRVNYRGTLTNGTEFDSSYKRNSPAEFPLKAVIPCWTEGVQKMKVGGKAQLVCPSDKAYGEQGSPPVIPPGATLLFEVELLGIVSQTVPGSPKK